MSVDFKTMNLEIKETLENDYQDVMWAGRLMMFFDFIEKSFNPDQIVDSYLISQLMNINCLEEIAEETNNENLSKFCSDSLPNVHAYYVSSFFIPYIEIALYKVSKKTDQKVVEKDIKSDITQVKLEKRTYIYACARR